MTSCPEAMVRRIWKFWKRDSWKVDFRPCRQRVELSATETDSWEVEFRPGSWDFEVGPWKTIVEFLPLRHGVGFRPLKDVVSIVWLRKTFNNCVSLRVEESPEVNKRSYLNNGVAWVFVSTKAFVNVLYYRKLRCLWLYNICPLLASTFFFFTFLIVQSHLLYSPTNDSDEGLICCLDLKKHIRRKQRCHPKMYPTSWLEAKIIPIFSEVPCPSFVLL